MAAIREVWAVGVVFVCFGTVHANLGQEGTFAFASYYGNHMVLQRGPQRANIWGYSPTVGDKVTVTIDGQSPVSTTVVGGPVSKGGIWSVKLPAITNPGPYVIKAVSSSGTIELSDILFGDVWICSGQSNMQFTVSMGYNASAEIADAENYPNIRVMTVDLQASAVPENDLVKVLQNWSVASSASIGGPEWSYFSALCWFYGKYLYRHRGYPIGLIDSDWGGSGIKPWMSLEGLENCVNVTRPIVMPTHPPGQFYVPKTPTVLWNSMIKPFSTMTIYGMIWYQGETNADDPQTYACLFPAMINDWREKFHAGSRGETDAAFPFGFVQLSAWLRQETVGGFPGLRWAQTADFGYVPNSLMKKVFMAVSMDLADYNGSWNTTHPRNKQDVALRLGLAAEAVAYNVENLVYQGPFPTTISVNPTKGVVTIEYDRGRTPIQVVGTDGFEVCCSIDSGAKCNDNDPEWKAAPISSHRTTELDLAYRPNCLVGSHILGVRYAWRSSPCPFKQCAVYNKDNGLPAPPYRSIAFYA